MQGGQKLSEEAVALYEKATTTFLKNNFLLHFAYADFEEVCHNCCCTDDIEVITRSIMFSYFCLFFKYLGTNIFILIRVEKGIKRSAIY